MAAGGPLCLPCLRAQDRADEEHRDMGDHECRYPLDGPYDCPCPGPHKPYQPPRFGFTSSKQD